MTRDDIVNLASKLKETYKTTNPFRIAEMLNIDCNFVALKKDAVQAYILKPYDYGAPCIYINSNFDKKSQQVFYTHELGHAILHKNAYNHYDGN